MFPVPRLNGVAAATAVARAAAKTATCLKVVAVAAVASEEKRGVASLAIAPVAVSVGAAAAVAAEDQKEISAEMAAGRDAWTAALDKALKQRRVGGAMLAEHWPRARLAAVATASA